MSNQLDLKRFAELDGPVIFVGFHPDDLDFHTGGLAALLVEAGADVIYVVATSGEGAGSPEVRENEQRLAALCVGVQRVEFLRLKDGALAKEYFAGRLTKRMEHLIRKIKPSVVVSFCPANLTSLSWGAEHPDHRYGALAVWDAVYPGARQDEVSSWWQFWRKSLPGHKVQEVLWFGDDLPSPYDGNVFVSVDSAWPAIENSLRSHRSQWHDGERALEKAAARANRAAAKHGLSGLAEEYHQIFVE